MVCLHFLTHLEIFPKTGYYLLFYGLIYTMKNKYSVNKIPHLETHFLLRIFNNLLIFSCYDIMGWTTLFFLIKTHLETHLETNFLLRKMSKNTKNGKKGGIKCELYRINYHILFVSYILTFFTHIASQ